MVMATMADAHREWHRNAGVPMGTPGCPMDACHLPDDYEQDPTHYVVVADLRLACWSMDEAKRVAREQAALLGKAAKIERAAGYQAQWAPPAPEAPATPALSALAARMTGKPCAQPPSHAKSVCGLDGSNSIGGIEAAMGLLPEPAPEYCGREECDGEPCDPRRHQTSPAPSTQASTGPLADRAGEPTYDGTYTVVDSGKTYRVKTQPDDAEFAPGKQVLGYLSGPDNEKDYTDFAFVVNGHPMIWSRFKGNYALTQEARALMADLPGKVERGEVLLAARCFRCGHKLTVSTSIYQGYGPECAKKAGVL